MTDSELPLFVESFLVGLEALMRRHQVVVGVSITSDLFAQELDAAGSETTITSTMEWIRSETELVHRE